MKLGGEVNENNRIQHAFHGNHPQFNINLSPSEYAEKYRRLSSDISTITGKYNYDITPYLREIIDTLSPYHPAKVVGVMKAAQIGYTEGVIVNGILWIIANNPGNIMSLSADADLSEEMVTKRLDPGIVSCGIQNLIRPNTRKRRNARSGDTSKSKEFAGGNAFFGGLQSVNKLGKQRSIKYGFFDDWDAAPISDKEQGNIFDLLQQRFATAANTMKQYYISTPQSQPSNIEIVYNKGDKRKWMLPCPKCGKSIDIQWKQIKFTKTKSKLNEKSVCYECQECSNTFKEKYKYEMNLSGIWIPTCEPSQFGYYSYHIPAWVSAPHMYNWNHYVRKWIEIFSSGTESISKMKVFKNVNEGFPWKDKIQQVKKDRLAKNTRSYEIGTVPSNKAIADGSGDIVLLTFACDLNGNIDDARLDYEVVGWSKSGSCYSIDAGSIGTYRRGNKDIEREKLTYRNEAPNNVWDIVQKIIEREYVTDEGRTMMIAKSCIDTGYLDSFAWKFIDKFDIAVIGVKGGGSDKFVKVNSNAPLFKIGRTHAKSYILDVDSLKNRLSDNINLVWQKDCSQPAGFMNFPEPNYKQKKYTTKYFAEYETERKVVETNDDGDIIGYKWERKSTYADNHYFDCAVYNLALREIMIHDIGRATGNKTPNWFDVVAVIEG